VYVLPLQAKYPKGFSSPDSTCTQIKQTAFAESLPVIR